MDAGPVENPWRKGILISLLFVLLYISIFIPIINFVTVFVALYAYFTWFRRKRTLQDQLLARRCLRPNPEHTYDNYIYKAHYLRVLSIPLALVFCLLAFTFSTPALVITFVILSIIMLLVSSVMLTPLRYTILNEMIRGRCVHFANEQNKTESVSDDD